MRIVLLMWSSENQERSQDDRRWNPKVKIRTVNEVRSAREFEFNTEKDHEKLPLFSFSSLEAATDYFADANKLGEGCYRPRRPVYKVNDSVFYLPNDGKPS